MLTASEWQHRWHPERTVWAGDVKDGMKRMYGADALGRRFIQANPKAMVAALVVDIDRPGAVMDALGRPREHPDPSWVVETPRGAHVGWWLADPVTRTDAAHEKPLRYLARIQEGLIRSLGADPAYGGFITRNPVWPDLGPGEVLWGTAHSYELHELRTPSMPSQLPRKLETTRSDLGRNCALFEHGRVEAYRMYREMNYPGADALYRPTISHLTSLNSQLPESAGGPLPTNEVLGIARSISSWTARRHTRENFIQRQRVLGARGGIKSGETRRTVVDERAQSILGDVR